MSTYGDWLGNVPAEITHDPIWKLEVYRLAFFASDIGWEDARALYSKPLTRELADQLYRALGSISANLTEGFSRSRPLDRARYFEIALGSARESKDWYYRARHVLAPEVVQHRITLLAQIVGMLTNLIPQQRSRAFREQQPEYGSPVTALADTVPMP